MAMGNNSAHSRPRLPGKRHMVTSHAAPTPPTATPRPTPNISNSELPT